MRKRVSIRSGGEGVSREWKAFCAAAALASLALTTPARAGDLPQDMTIALGGDMIGPYHALSGPHDQAFEAMADLFRKADVGFSNQEGSIFDLDGFAGYPAPETGGGYPRQVKAFAGELRAMGVTIVSKANNHATDWGAAGLAASLASLAQADVVAAGAGMDAAAALRPAYRETGKGKVALVSTASTFPLMALPAAPVTRYGETSRPGPGISALHAHAVRLVTAAQLAALKEIAGPVGMEAGATGADVRIADQIFRAAAAPGVTWEARPEDVAGLLSSIRAARAAANLVLFAIHAHETAGLADEMPPRDFEPLVLHRANEMPDANNPVPADFLPALFHQAVDAGADMVVRTGPHVLNGIEIYKGRPIFYGLGSLFFDFGGRRSYTAPAGQVISLPDGWFETVVPVLDYRRGKLAALRLYPAVIKAEAGLQGGLPHRATGADAQRILGRLRDLSRAYGTEIRIEGDVGVVRLSGG